MNSCDCFIGDIVRPKGFILTDFYILGLSTYAFQVLIMYTYLEIMYCCIDDSLLLMTANCCVWMTVDDS